MNGLREAFDETKDLTGYDSGQYVQISYNRKTGDILTYCHYSLGHNDWIMYRDPNIVTVCTASNPMPMQEIADAIYETVEMAKKYS